MSTVEAIYEKAKALPDELQTEALRYVNFLHSQRQAQQEATEWARHSGGQLLKHYAPADDVYDQD